MNCICMFQVAGLESDCLFKANERMVLRIYLTTLAVDDLSDMTLYPKVCVSSVLLMSSSTVNLKQI
jgi:hypothetical protein